MKLNSIVFHRDVYDYKEPLKVVGVRESELELEGDYSGGTHNVCQKDWLPIDGVSYIYNHRYKKECRNTALHIKSITPSCKSTEMKHMTNFLYMVLELTKGV